MKKLIAEFSRRIEGEAVGHGLGKKPAAFIVLIPFAIVIGYAGLVLVPRTNYFAEWAVEENHLVEQLSFIFPMMGFVIGLMLCRGLISKREGPRLFWFYFIFSIVLLGVAGEEVSWGQQFIHFHTPAEIIDLNEQRELNLHNLYILQDHLEIFPLVFGLAGMAGVWLSRKRYLQEIAPPYLLLSWFFVIAFDSAVDLFQDLIIIQETLDYVVNVIDEVVEMMVGISCFLFMWLHYRRFRLKWKADSSSGARS